MESKFAFISTYSFAFTISNVSPPSISCDEVYFEYFLLLELIQDGKKAKEIKKLSMEIRTCVSAPVNAESINCSEENKRGLSVNLKVEPGYISSESPELPLELTIHNRSRSNISAVKVIFVQKREVRGSKARKELLNVTINGTPSMRENQLPIRYSFPIPQADLASYPSYNYSMPSSIFRSVSVSYVLKVELCVDGVFNNIKLKVPVFVANN